MKYSPTAVQIGRTGAFVELQVGPTVVRMTPLEAEEMIHAIERTITQIAQPKTHERVH